MGLSAALLEQWVEYPIGVTVCLLRLFARVRVVGWGNLYYDDLFAFLAIVSRFISRRNRENQLTNSFTYRSSGLLRRRRYIS